MRFLLLFAALAAAVAGYNVSTVYVVDVRGVVGPHTYWQVAKAVEAAERGGGAVLLLLSTPGGLAAPAKRIMGLVLHSKVPVLGYVYGEEAASAGTYILMATHIAGMAPHSKIGACQPVLLVFLVEDPGVIAQHLSILAEAMSRRGRNVEFAERCVRSKEYLIGAEEAQKMGVVEVVAGNFVEFVKRANGTAVSLDGVEDKVFFHSPKYVLVAPGPVELFQSWHLPESPAALLYFSTLPLLLHVALFLAAMYAVLLYAKMRGWAAVANLSAFVLALYVSLATLPPPWLLASVAGAVAILADLFICRHTRGFVAFAAAFVPQTAVSAFYQEGAAAVAWAIALIISASAAGAVIYISRRKRPQVPSW